MKLTHRQGSHLKTAKRRQKTALLFLILPLKNTNCCYTEHIHGSCKTVHTLSSTSQLPCTVTETICVDHHGQPTLTVMRLTLGLHSPRPSPPSGAHHSPVAERTDCFSVWRRCSLGREEIYFPVRDSFPGWRWPWLLRAVWYKAGSWRSS